MALRRAGKGYVLGVASDQMFNSWGCMPSISGTAGEIAATLEASAWQRLSAGEGTQGPRLYDWAYLALADLEANEYGEDRSGLWTRGLLIRRGLADGKMAFFTTWCPTGTSIETLVRVEGRWAEQPKVPRAMRVERLRRASRMDLRWRRMNWASTIMVKRQETD